MKKQNWKNSDRIGGASKLFLLGCLAVAKKIIVSDSIPRQFDII